MAREKLSRVDGSRGAPMGRPGFNHFSTEEAETGQPLIRLQKVQMSEGYDEGGAYWGHPHNLWYAHAYHLEMFFRADDRDDAKACVRKKIPSARFYR